MDTHALIWAWTAPHRFTPAALKTVEDSSNVILISAASAWEIATKKRSGKLSQAAELERNFSENILGAGFTLIPIDAETALRAGRLPGSHLDPFDRILAAHALAEDIPILSADHLLDTFGVRRIW